MDDIHDERRTIGEASSSHLTEATTLHATKETMMPKRPM